MNVTPQSIPDLLLIEPDVFGDARGFFVETWNAKRYSDAGIPYHFVQDNLSFSRQGIVRGLHAQNPNPQGKLIQDTVRSLAWVRLTIISRHRVLNARFVVDL